jgi:UDP-glucose 4-epimerase
MKTLITGSSGHLGEALVRTFRSAGREFVGVDINAGPCTTHVGSIFDRDFVKSAMEGVQNVLHTATLHKPHVPTHRMHAFVETNVTGTLTLLEEAVAAGVSAFVLTSTTSAFGDALRPGSDSPAAWITEEILPIPRNIYGTTKCAAEDLCRLFHRKMGLNCVILRTSRFFPEADDDPSRRAAFSDENLKVNEFLHRRVELEDVVNAHVVALEKAGELGFGRYIISATSPFSREQTSELRRNLPEVLRALVPQYEEIYKTRGWSMFDGIDRVYVNDAARKDLGWNPRYTFSSILDMLRAGRKPWSELTRAVGSKGYHHDAYSALLVAAWLL